MALPENDEESQWKKKMDDKRFTHTAGDTLSSPFQCFCWFINLQRREPVRLSAGDQCLLGYARRVNLDIMWSREKSTVGNTLSALKKAKGVKGGFGLDSSDYRVRSLASQQWCWVSDCIGNA